MPTKVRRSKESKSTSLSKTLNNVPQQLTYLHLERLKFLSSDLWKVVLKLPVNLLCKHPLWNGLDSASVYLGCL
jgi:hypothetical protein